MKKIIIKTASIFLSLIMLISLVQVQSFAEGNQLKQSYDDFMANYGIFFEGIKNLEGYMAPVEGRDDVCEIAYEYDNFKGEHKIGYTGIYYNEKTGDVYGRNDDGMFGLGFDVNVKEMYSYCPVNAWQRQMGFCPAYDALAFCVGYRYITRRVKFSYGGQDWMVQIWKGQYFSGMGGEIGLYEKPSDRLSNFYDCVDDADMPQMSLKVYDEEKVYIDREMMTHWWMNGFTVSKMKKPSDVTLQSTIIFADSGMTEAFLEALDEFDEMSYKLDGNAVNITW